MKFTIQVTYSTRDDKGRLARPKSVFWTEAHDIGAAIREATEAFSGQDAKLGAILPGHHVHLP